LIEQKEPKEVSLGKFESEGESKPNNPMVVNEEHFFRKLCSCPGLAALLNIQADLDNDPTRLIEIVEIGKQLLMTRGTLTTFSIANDVSRYFDIVTALSIASLPGLQALNIMRLHKP
jgi:hypothetical protein